MADDDLEGALAQQMAAMVFAATEAQAIAPPIELPAEPRAPLELIADPKLIALVHGRFRPQIARTPHLRTFAGELPYHLDPVDWRTGFLEVHEGGAPMDIREGMREVVPQALLRDLFRPEYSKEPVSLDYVELPLDPGARRAFAELRGQQKLEPIPHIPRSIDALQARIDERRAFIDGKWKPTLDDSEPRRDVFVVIEPYLSS